MLTLVPEYSYYLAVAIEGVAVLVIVFGLLIAVARTVIHRAREGGWFGSYADLRKSIGRTLLIGLDFLLAAEIIRSVMAGETMYAAATLGIIVVVRIFLSIAIDMEIKGRWPWQARAIELKERRLAEEIEANLKSIAEAAD